jgi:hypothetical protein
MLIIQPRAGMVEIWAIESFVLLAYIHRLLLQRDLERIYIPNNVYVQTAILFV